MGKVYFVSGIDTGIGKTIVTGLMARSLSAQGRDVITVKMVQTGNDGFSEDIDLHRKLCGIDKLPEDIEGLTMPQIFKFPSSPLLAASLEGKTVDIEKIKASAKTCAERHDIVLVESAGGLCVPLTEDKLSIDLALECDWPLILVTCGRLGAINHTLVSIEVAKTKGLRIAGIVHNWHADADDQINADAIAAEKRAVQRMGYSIPIIEVGKIDLNNPDYQVDFSEIIK